MNHYIWIDGSLTYNKSSLAIPLGVLKGGTGECPDNMYVYIGSTPRDYQKSYRLKCCTALILTLLKEPKSAMPSYDYECPICQSQVEVYRPMRDDSPVWCSNGDGGVMTKVYLVPIATVVPPNMQAAGDKSKYYGIKNIYTGEGITKDTNVGSPPGIKVRSPK